MFRIENQNGKSNITFVCDKDEFSGVKKIAEKVCLDVERVTGLKPEVHEEDFSATSVGGDLPKTNTNNTVFFSTLGKSSFADKLAQEAGLSSQITEIAGKRECYVFAVQNDKIIIIGSDKRGSIYGLFHLSELMGVSPLVDWADLMPVRRNCLELEEGTFVSKEPSVRFRGFFINDEWPAFGNWANHNFGGVNAKMYEHVFELLLRLKGNYLWPAMWASRFSDDGPGLANAELADELGVVMGASHHEPCCRAGEEYKHLRGKDSIYGDAWNFRSNKEGITRFWEDGLKRNGKFENVITVGMRGEADTAILKNATLADNIELLRDVLQTQNQLIKKYVNEDIQQVPRMLALYKEVEPYFYGDKHTKGLIGSPELEGVTLMLCDDNHGNLRTVPTKEMRSHKGGYGMYYHFDYHGWPYSYEWFNTSYLPKVKEQMCAAYDFGIRDLWIVNVGDIMTTEFPLSYFLDLAYDYEKYSADEYTTEKYTCEWIERQFAGLDSAAKEKIFGIITEYTRLAHLRRTECIQPLTYHPVNFSEGDLILARAEKVMEAAMELKKSIPAEYIPAFYTQVYLPACGNMNVLKMQLFQGKNHWLVNKGILYGNVFVEKIKDCLDFDRKLVAEADSVDNGKFFAMGWSEHFGFTAWNEEENNYPVYYSTDGARKPRLVVWLEGQENTTCGLDWTKKSLYSNAFRNPETEKVEINLASGSEKESPFKVSVTKPWLSVDKSEGLVRVQDGIVKLSVIIDRKKLEEDSEKTACVKINNSVGNSVNVGVTIVFNAEVPSLDYPKGTFVQTEDYISIEAEHFVRKTPSAAGEWKVLPGYGKTLSAVKTFPVTENYDKGKNAPCIEYAFALDNEDVLSFDFYLNPSNPAYKDNKLQFIAEINGEKILKDVVDSKTFAVGDNQQPWGMDITNNIRVSSVYAAGKKGLNSLKLYPVTPNIVLEKIVIHSANIKMPDSYLGTPETFRI